MVTVPVRVLSCAYSCYGVSFMRLLICRLMFVRSVYVSLFVWSPCLPEGSVPDAAIISMNHTITIFIIMTNSNNVTKYYHYYHHCH